MNTFKDYFLHNMDDKEFEQLTVSICQDWFGVGVTGFADGKDGGRDAKFTGTAQTYPSTSEPWNGHTVVQAKHTIKPNASCSDSDFKGYYDPASKKTEIKKIKKLNEDGILDHYIVFTNRKLTAGAEQSLVKNIAEAGATSCAIIGLEKLSRYLQENTSIAKGLSCYGYVLPFEFKPEDMISVIEGLYDGIDKFESQFASELDFELVNKKKKKNKVNKMSDNYYEGVVVNECMPHFSKLESFLNNDRNKKYRDIYHDIADELRQKIIIFRDQFEWFEEILVYLFDEIKAKAPSLTGKRRYATLLLCYMYFDCDIGEREPKTEC